MVLVGPAARGGGARDGLALGAAPVNATSTTTTAAGKALQRLVIRSSPEDGKPSISQFGGARSGCQVLNRRLQLSTSADGGDTLNASPLLRQRDALLGAPNGGAGGEGADALAPPARAQDHDQTQEVKRRQDVADLGRAVCDIEASKRLSLDPQVVALVFRASRPAITVRL
jgi:hypothetical protein